VEPDLSTVAARAALTGVCVAVAGNEILIEATPAEVFDVLVDPAAFVVWVVGAKEIRDVDDGWPAPGTRIHHTIGAGPFTVQDTTAIRRIDPPRHLELGVRFRPAGEGTVVVDLEPAYGGRCTRVRFSETFDAGAAGCSWGWPVDQLTRLRNNLSLHRLRQLVLRRTGGDLRLAAGPDPGDVPPIAPRSHPDTTAGPDPGGPPGA
jgi:uncharacterized protein YndB with AHSA1/START domain